MNWFMSDSSKLTNEIIELHLHKDIDKRFFSKFLKGRIDPYVDYKLKKNRFGKFRSISSPLPHLKAIQTWILGGLYEIPCHPSAHAYVPGKSVVTAASEHLGMTWGIRLDLEDFFHHVTHHRISSALINDMEPVKAKLFATLMTRSPQDIRSRVPSKYNRRFSFWASHKWRLWLSALVVRRRDSFDVWPASRWETQEITSSLLLNEQKKRRFLPQGSPTSGYAANLAFKKLDQRISRYLKALGFQYTRYSDDILISTKSVTFNRDLAGQIISWIQGQLAVDGYTLNRKKTRLLTPGSRMAYLGLLLDGEQTKLPKEVRERIAGELRDISKFGYESSEARFQQGLSRVRRAPAKESNQFNEYWPVLVGWVSWVQAADQKFFNKLKSQYYQPDLVYNYGDDPRLESEKLLSDLFNRKSELPAAEAIGSGPKIIDIDPKELLGF